MEARRNPSREPTEVLHLAAAAVLEAAVDGIVVIDEAGTVRYVNPAVERMFGYAAAEVVERNVKLLMPEPYAGEHDRYIQDYLRTGVRKIIGIGREVEARHKDGHSFPVDLAVSELRTPEGRAFTGIVRDLSERDRVRSELAAERDRAQLYLEIAPILFLRLDAEGRVCLINRAGCELLGYEEHQILGQDWFARFLPARQRDQIRAVFQQLRAGQEEAGMRHRRQENAVLTRYGEERLVEWHYTTLRDAEGAFAGTLSTGIDISERARLSQALVEQESLVRLGEMAAVVAHEIRNPLAGIGGALQVLARRFAADIPDRPIIDEVLERLDGLNSTLDELLLFARPRAPLRAPVPARDLIDKCIAGFRDDPRAEKLEIEVRGDPMPILGDAEQLQAVCLNLLLNAAQAMQYAGRLLVELEQDGSDSLQIRVRDHGPGIPAELRDKVLQPFFTTKSRGSGLGLALANRVVQMHEGELHLDFPAEGGTIVTLRLPSLARP